MQNQLRIQGRHYEQLKEHLFPGDGKEAVALLLCGRYESDGLSILISHQLLLIPHEECERDEHFVRWKTERVLPFFEKMENKNFGLVKIHSHPTGYPEFSDVDDQSDCELFQTAFNWSETTSPNASVIMLPDYSFFGRVFNEKVEHQPLDKILIAGDQIEFWTDKREVVSADDFNLRTIQAFGDGTYKKLRDLKVGVVGCSGTGSPTIEQLKRLGVSSLVLIDPDTIERKNLNRIIQAKLCDEGKQKVAVLEADIIETGLPTKVVTYGKNLFDTKPGLYELITCDVIFGCVDTVEGRYLLNQITNMYCIPYFDMGVLLEADGKGSVDTVVGSVNYLQPGMSSLISRGAISAKRLASEGLKRTDPEAYEEQLKQSYVMGVDVERPAVISLNMLISSIAIMEFLNRLHKFKEERGNNYAKVTIDYCSGCIINQREEEFIKDTLSEKNAGRGDCVPFLCTPAFG